MSTKTTYKWVTAGLVDLKLNMNTALTYAVGETYDRATAYDGFELPDGSSLGRNPMAHWGFSVYPYTHRGSWGPPPDVIRVNSDWGTRHTWRLLQVEIDLDDVIILGASQSRHPHWNDLIEQFPNARFCDGLLPGQLIVTRMTVVDEIEDWLDTIDWTTRPPGVLGLPL